MKALLEHARSHRYGVLACNLLSYDMLLGGIAAAEESDAPLILQLAPVQFDTSPLEYLGPIMVDLAKKSTAPIVVHLDHGFDLEEIKKAIEIGFSSVMIDASSYELEDNIRYTRRVVDLAHASGVDVEAEIGSIGNETSDGSELRETPSDLTDPAMAVQFVDRTGCDTLAVAIGNAHGLHRTAPKLDIDRLSEIDARIDIPLVLHGGSGTSDKDFKRCIKNGITKINIASTIHRTYVEHLDAGKQPYASHFHHMVGVTRNAVKEFIERFLSNGHGAEFLEHEKRQRR